MRGLVFDRRAFLRASGASFLASLTPWQSEAMAANEAVFGSAWFTDDGQFGAALLSENGTVIAHVPLPDRGHEVIFNPFDRRRAVVFARRPGTFAVAFTSDRSHEPLLFSCPANRHFYGHGTFSVDGKLLFATENDFDGARGMIGIYDATEGFRRVGEFFSGGIGPHDVLLMPDGKTLAIANGGIETHPDYGRAKLNIDSMQPSLAFIDTRTGELIETHALAASLSKISTRHMAMDGEGSIWLAGQHEGNPEDGAPLLSRWSETDGLLPVRLPRQATRRLQGYIGSIAADTASGTIAITSPVGNTMIRFQSDDISSPRIRVQDRMCGVANGTNGFVWTSLNGVDRFEISGLGQRAWRWDNHIGKSPA